MGRGRWKRVKRGGNGRRKREKKEKAIDLERFFFFLSSLVVEFFFPFQPLHLLAFLVIYKGMPRSLSIFTPR